MAGVEAVTCIMGGAEGVRVELLPELKPRLLGVEPAPEPGTAVKLKGQKGTGKRHAKTEENNLLLDIPE